MARSICPECHSAGSIDRDFCEVCYADLDDLPPRAEGSGPSSGPFDHNEHRPGPPSASFHPLRFTHVVEELRAITRLAAEGPELDGERVAAACRRAESLLVLLRRRFLQDVVAAPAAATAIR